LRGNLFHVVEEWLNEFVELGAGGKHGKRPAIEKFCAEIFFQPGNLAADGGLLNPVGDISHGPGNAAVFHHIIEEFKVMDIHDRRIRC
jgi:hypothetical protein